LPFSRKFSSDRTLCYAPCAPSRHPLRLHSTRACAAAASLDMNTGCLVDICAPTVSSSVSQFYTLFKTI